MNSQPTIIAATAYKPLLLLLEGAAQAGGMAIAQVAPAAEPMAAALSAGGVGLVVVHANSGQEEWLHLVDSVKSVCSDAKVIAFGESADVGVIARSIVHGVVNYIPLNACSGPREVKAILEDAISDKEVSADSVFGRVKAMLPVGPLSSGRYRSPAGKYFSHEEAIKQCVSLGLTAEETSRFLAVAEHDARKAETDVNRKVLAGPLLPTKQLVVVGVMLLATFAVLSVLGRKKEKHFVPVSGTVTLEGQPLRDVLVYFSKEGGSHIASGKTDEAGKYSLSTLKPGDGAEAGTHVVWLGVPSQVRMHIDMNDPQYAEKMLRLTQEIASEQKAGEQGGDHGVPASYLDMRSSPLRAEISGRSPLRRDLDVTR